MSAPLDRWRVVLTAVVFWTGVGAVFAGTRLPSASHWREPVLFSMAEWWSWGLLAPLVIAIDRRLPFSIRQPGRRLAFHVLPGMAMAVVYILLFATLAAALGVRPWSRLVDGSLRHDALDGLFLWSLVVYFLIVGAWSAWTHLQRRIAAEVRVERLERQFSQARLATLRMQIDPHFLFNALNTISAHLEADPRVARQMIEHLGNLLRLSLHSGNRSEVTLREELGFLDHYLAIQRLRFEERLELTFDIDPEVLDAAVPSLLLQPLVENAIRHGVAGRARGGAVVISASAAAGRMKISVTDDGVGMPVGWRLAGSTGIGLASTSERILATHAQARLDVRARPGGGTEVEMSWPWAPAKELGS